MTNYFMKDYISYYDYKVLNELNARQSKKKNAIDIKNKNSIIGSIDNILSSYLKDKYVPFFQKDINGDFRFENNNHIINSNSSIKENDINKFIKNDNITVDSLKNKNFQNLVVKYFLNIDKSTNEYLLKPIVSIKGIEDEILQKINSYLPKIKELYNDNTYIQLLNYFGLDINNTYVKTENYNHFINELISYVNRNNTFLIRESVQNNDFIQELNNFLFGNPKEPIDFHLNGDIKKYIQDIVENPTESKKETQDSTDSNKYITEEDSIGNGVFNQINKLSFDEVKIFNNSYKNKINEIFIQSVEKSLSKIVSNAKEISFKAIATTSNKDNTTEFYKNLFNNISKKEESNDIITEDKSADTLITYGSVFSYDNVLEVEDSIIDSIKKDICKSIQSSILNNLRTCKIKVRLNKLKFSNSTILGKYKNGRYDINVNVSFNPKDIQFKINKDKKIIIIKFLLNLRAKNRSKPIIDEAAGVANTSLGLLNALGKAGSMGIRTK